MARVGSAGRPIAYFITFACYGARLHGDPKGSVDRFHNVPNTPAIEPSPARVHFERKLSRGTSVTLDADDRALVLGALRQHCEYREWMLHAAHIRSNHVHIVLAADVAPTDAMSQLKRYASRALNAARGRSPRRWARHGSTRYLWTAEQMALAVDYVAREQGAPMALYLEGQGS